MYQNVAFIFIYKLFMLFCRAVGCKMEKILREVWKSNFCADELEDRLCCCLSAVAIPRVSVRPGHLKNQEHRTSAGNGQFE